MRNSTLFFMLTLSLLVGTTYSQQFKSYYNKKNQFTVSYPPTWKKQLQSNKSPVKFAVSSNDHFWPDAVVAVMMTKSDTVTLERIFYEHVKHLRDQHCEVILDANETMINSRKYLSFTSDSYHGTVKNNLTEYLTIDDGKIITFYLRVNNVARLEEFRQTLLKIIYSFELN